VATTATPPTGSKLEGIGLGSIGTILTTPLTFIASAPSKLATLPPSTGGRATTACSMSGRRGSMPNTALPVVMSMLSTRPMSARPI
jgi:hypothetical protein